MGKRGGDEDVDENEAEGERDGEGKGKRGLKGRDREIECRPKQVIPSSSQSPWAIYTSMKRSIEALGRR